MNARMNVNLNECHNMTDEALINIAEGCLNLRSVDLFECSGITIKGVRGLAEKCPHLTSVDLTDTKLDCRIIKQNFSHITFTI